MKPGRTILWLAGLILCLGIPAGTGRWMLPRIRLAGLVAQPVQKFQTDIKQSDLRISQLREQLAAGRPAPAQLRLRFSRLELDYAVFYDLDGLEIYFQYREDRWDRRAERKVRHLVAGQAYAVQGSWKGVYADQKLQTQNQHDFADILKNSNNPLVFAFEEARALRMEQILF